MNIINDLLLNYYFLAFISAWILATLVKSLIFYFQGRGFNLQDGFNNGGMPSSHTAVTTALTIALLIKTGFSEYFFISMVFTSIVISDAFRVRYNLGIQGDKLNALLKKDNQSTINVIHGHTFSQVVGGIILGIIVALALFLIL